jgi:hypothetical protein
MTSAARAADRFITASVFGLTVMAVWTLVIKFLAPLLWAVAERAGGREAVAPVMWDFWWVAHLALALLLWRRHRWAWSFGIGVAVVEIAIVAAKFFVYLRGLQAPDLSFWRLLWFTNKVYVLGFFLVFLPLLLRPGMRQELTSRTVGDRHG